MGVPCSSVCVYVGAGAAGSSTASGISEAIPAAGVSTAAGVAAGGV